VESSLSLHHDGDVVVELWVRFVLRGVIHLVIQGRSFLGIFKDNGVAHQLGSLFLYCFHILCLQDARPLLSGKMLPKLLLHLHM
jgi:hypothetical protein